MGGGRILRPDELYWFILVFLLTGTVRFGMGLGEEEPRDVTALKPSDVNTVVYRLERSKLKYNNLHQKAFQKSLVS